MSRVIILSGISGSGKSTLAGEHTGATIVSADRHFMQPDGSYAFDASKLGVAHASCFRSFVEAMQRGEGVIVVDNTNTTVEEISPYVLGAQAFGYSPEVVTVTVKVGRLPDCLARNTHGVTPDTLTRQFRRLNERTLPPWWAAREVKATF
jgi:predicted kinase